MGQDQGRDRERDRDSEREPERGWDQDRDPDLRQLAADAYVYGYPLVAGLRTVAASVARGFGEVPAAGFNAFSHAGSFSHAGPPASQGTSVSIDNDTLCSTAHLNLSGGPLSLRVPDTAGAYYVLRFVDAWGNNFAYVGKRATGTGEQRWLLVPPGWSAGGLAVGGSPAGSLPAGITGVIRVPTVVASVVGRFACAGADDVARVRGLRRQLRLSPVDASATRRVRLPETGGAGPDELMFFERMRVWMAAFPPAVADRVYARRFGPLGLLGGTSMLKVGPELAAVLKAGFAEGLARVERARGEAAGDGEPGAWLADPHAFDYNLDHFEVGTIDAPQWKMPDRTASYTARAAAVGGGLWGEHGYEAVHALASTDADGEQLNGKHAYTLRFEVTPPVDAFWSLTMYDSPAHRLVAHRLGRHSGGQGSALVHAADGSLTLVISRDRPVDPVMAANWLPAPDGDFRPLLRMYEPGQAVLDARYQIPKIRKVR